MDRLEELKKEADKFECFDSFFAGLPPDREKNSVWRYERYLIEYNKKLITHIYTSAIEDAIGAVDINFQENNPQHLDTTKVVNDVYRTLLHPELEKRLQALLPQQ